MTIGTKLALLNCSGDRFTLILMRLGQVAASAQAALTTHSPIDTIKPMFSAMAMKSPGRSNPRSG